MAGYNLICILGHTAGGKTSLAANTALKYNGEIISADSRQVYRGMDLGTGKDYDDYIVHGKKVAYHLIDIADAGYEYSVFEFRRDFTHAFEDITKRGKLTVMCGGSGLYIEAVLRNYQMLNVPVNAALRKSLESKNMDELVEILRSYGAIHNSTDTESMKRTIRAIEIADYQKDNIVSESDMPDLNPLVVGLSFEREARRSRITFRLQQRLDEGMADEVKALLDKGVEAAKLEYYGLEYKFLTQYVTGRLTYEEMFTALNTAIHRFAKRQMTYFRGMERRGIKIHWLDGELAMDEKLSKIDKWYSAT